MRISTPRAVVGCSLVAAFLTAAAPQAQYRYDPWADRYGRDGRYDARSPLARVEAGTYVTVRTREPIETNRRDARMFPAVVDQDVWDNYNRLAVPAIPRGSPAELRVRSAPDGDLILDLDAIIVDGRRYVVDARADRMESRGQADSNGHAGEYIGGGALLGTIIGAIAGGGKGAAIGAVAGAGAGAAGTLLTRGREVRVPAGSQLTFRLDRDLSLAGRADVSHERR